MNLDKVYVVDIEAKGLLHEIHDKSDFHVLSIAYKVGDKWKIKSTNREEDIKTIFENPDNVIVGHYFIPYDAPALEKMFKFKIKSTIIDSIGLSWYLHNTQSKHGLEEYGLKYGVPKVKIDPEEWKTLSYEKAEDRCSTDVKINVNLWVEFLKYLRELYNNDDKEVVRIIKYLNFIMTCYREQERQKIQVDLKKLQENLEYFQKLKQEKEEILRAAMPKVPKKVKRSKPKNLYKKDGTLSVAGERWMNLVKVVIYQKNMKGK